MDDKINISIDSEINTLQGVLIHTPGAEVENMTPINAERALYSDILNLSVVSYEYELFKSVLKQFTTAYEIKDLLQQTLTLSEAREHLLSRICKDEDVNGIRTYLDKLAEKELARQLIEGVPLVKNTLTKFLSNDRYALQPLHNFFFTRDASFCVNNTVYISRMGNKVREREALILETIFSFHPLFKGNKLVTSSHLDARSDIFFEGGDFLVIRNDILLVGIGPRTSSQGIDFILRNLQKEKQIKHLIVQELPKTPESFIHLDMVFTMIDENLFMIYEPVVLSRHEFQTVHITLSGGKTQSISEVKNIPHILSQLGIAADLATCGGNTDDWTQEREQWHSGANFFALGPGKVLSYDRNSHTVDALNKKGLAVLPAGDVLSGKVNLPEYDKYVITIEGSELARGGGGCRCMTMPVVRK